MVQKVFKIIHKSSSLCDPIIRTIRFFHEGHLRKDGESSFLWRKSMEDMVYIFGQFEG